MKYKVAITSQSDVAAWVSSEVFMDNVDMDDLACRDAEVVLDCYHPDWFWPGDRGDKYFIPPAFEFKNGHLSGINGRHRAILLCRHMTIIPMLLVRPDNWPEDKLNEIMLRKIEEDEIVELPDLPTNESLSEHEEFYPSKTSKIIKVSINF